MQEKKGKKKQSSKHDAYSIVCVFICFFPYFNGSPVSAHQTGCSHIARRHLSEEARGLKLQIRSLELVLFMQIRSLSSGDLLQVRIKKG